MSAGNHPTNRSHTGAVCLLLAACVSLPGGAAAAFAHESSRLHSAAELSLDLEPILFHPDAISAASAWEGRRARETLLLVQRALAAPLDLEERAALLYLEALALAAAGQSTQAFARFGELMEGGAPPGLDVQSAWHHARIGLRGDGAAESDTLWDALERIPLKSRNGPDASIFLARHHLAEGDLDLACGLAREVALWREGMAHEAPALLLETRCLEAQARAMRGDLPPIELRRLMEDVAWRYHSIAVRWPDVPAGESARAHADRLRSAGIRRAGPDIDAEIARAKRIVDRRGPRTSTSALIRARRILPEPGASRIDLLLAEVAAERRHFRTARRHYANVVRRTALPREVRAEAAYGLEELRSRRAPTASIDRLLSLAEDWRGTDAAILALARAGEIAWRLDRRAQATSAFERCISQGAEREAADRCRFGLSWLKWREGEIEEAGGLLSRLAHEDEMRRYWKARFLEENEDSASAKEIFMDLAAVRPLSFYSLLASSGLGRHEGRPPRRETARSEPPSHPDILAAHTLLRMGLESEARQLLSGHERASLGPGDRRLASILLSSMGETSRALRMAPLTWDGGLVEPPPGPAALDAVLAYPRAFSHAVESEHRHPEVPASLLYALIRAESAFDPEARSHARALGLTQVIRPTAEATAEQIGIEDFRFGMLTDPEISVRIGSAHLADLLRRYEGSVPLAIAAYNAGEPAVDRWLFRRGDLPADVFLHEIPFRETNLYTRRVLSFWAIYRALYEGEDGLPGDICFSRPFLPLSRPLVAEADTPQAVKVR